MSNGYPAQVIQVLELVEQQVLEADVPQELTDALTFCASKSLVTWEGGGRDYYAPFKTRKKKAEELRSGDLIQRIGWGLGDVFKVTEVRDCGETIVVVERGRDQEEFKRNAMAIVYDDPSPPPTYVELKFRLLPKGVEALSLFRMAKSHAEVPPKKKRRRQAVRTTTPLTLKQTEAVHLYGELRDFTSVGQRMGITRQMATRHYQAAMKKLGKSAMHKPKTQSLPKDRRGNESVANRD